MFSEKLRKLQLSGQSRFKHTTSGFQDYSNTQQMHKAWLVGQLVADTQTAATRAQLFSLALTTVWSLL